MTEQLTSSQLWMFELVLSSRQALHTLIYYLSKSPPPRFFSRLPAILHSGLLPLLLYQLIC